ncbi:MAG: helix-turn-helix domain-containing protein [Burkholderiaceae bacterium]|nr:helix-turn-helix domain-containing protein [Burkholderiaceae bacterium]
MPADRAAPTRRRGPGGATRASARTGAATAAAGPPAGTRGRPEHLESLERGLRVLALFGTDGTHEFTMAAVADRLGITRASALRILATLERLGYVHAGAHGYRLGVRVLSLGYAYLSSLGFGTVALPILEGLMNETGETCSIGVLDDDEVVYLVRSEARRIVRIDLHAGSRLPVYINSMGRLLLGAQSDEAIDRYLQALAPVAMTRRTVTDKRKLRELIVATRRTGWCYIEGEVEERVAGLSTRLRDATGATVAAINLTVMNRPRSRAKVLAELLPPLRRAADEIEAILRFGVAPR